MDTLKDIFIRLPPGIIAMAVLLFGFLVIVYAPRWLKVLVFVAAGASLVYSGPPGLPTPPA